MNLFCGGGSLGVQLLQRVHLDVSALQGCDTFARGPSCRQSCNCRNACGYGRTPNRLLVEPWIDAVRRVDDQVQALTLDEVNHVGASFFHLVHAFNSQARVFENLRRAVSCDQAESEFDEALCNFGNEGLVAIVCAYEDTARGRQDLSGGGLRFGESFAEAVGYAHHFAGGFHLGAEHSINAGELAPGKYRRLHIVEAASVEVGAALDVFWKEFAQLASSHQAGCDLG